MPIKFILGEAGCGKTEVLANIVKELLKTTKSKNIICLAFTHSAVNNLKERINEEDIDCKTLHSYFHIELNATHFCYGMVDVRDYIIIDEFSLIPVELLENIFKCCENSTIICGGDLLQLSPINEKRLNVDIRSFKQLFKNKSSELIGEEIEIGALMYMFEHLANTIWTTKYYRNADKMVLRKNYRSDTDVIKLLWKCIDNIDSIDVKRNMLDLDVKNYTVLSSRYDLLERSYQFPQKYEFKLPTKMGVCGFSKGDTVLLTENINSNFTNGDSVVIDGIKGVNLIIRNELDETIELDQNIDEFDRRFYDILPINYLTIHKAQGRGFDNVIIILNDLFEITMLYTAITRARHNVIFVRYDDTKNIQKPLTIVDTKDKNYLKITNHAFKLLRQIIYGN
jgi:hypothetical protein